MKRLSFIITAVALLTAYQGRAQVLTTGEPATATKADYVLPSDPKSMTVADENASSGYIVGKRVYPDRKKDRAKSPTGTATRSSDQTQKNPARRSRMGLMRGKAKRDSLR